MDTQFDLQQEALPAPEKKKWTLPKFNRRTVAIACAVLLVAVAVVLNVVLFSGDRVSDDPAPDAGSGMVDNSTGNSTTTDVDGYFSATQVSRQRARDEALEVLQGVVDNAEADEATKTAALMEIADLARAMEAEANIETLVVSKGFSQCVAVINGDTCSVVVKNEGTLSPAQISQINEIVYEQAGIEPLNIRIVTK